MRENNDTAVWEREVEKSVRGGFFLGGGCRGECFGCVLVVLSLLLCATRVHQAFMYDDQAEGREAYFNLCVTGSACQCVYVCLRW